MSGSQALFQAALRLYSRQPVREWRAYLCNIVHPFWPLMKAADIVSSRVTERADPAAQDEGWLWQQHLGEIDIDPGSGQLHRRGRRLDLPAALPVEHKRGRPDITGYFGGRVIPREPALVLFADAEVSFGTFVTRLLPRFFALDAFGVPADTLLLVTLNMGRTAWFQHAISDGVFRHRPVELFRVASMIRTPQLDEIAIPPLAEPALARMQARLAQLYPPLPDQDASPVLICEEAKRRAPALLARLAQARPELASGVRVLDPHVAPLRDLVRAAASARVLVAPESGELAAALLAPNPAQTLVLLGGPTPLAGLVATRSGKALTTG